MTAIPFIIIGAAAVTLIVNEPEFSIVAVGYFGLLLFVIGVVFRRH